MKFYKTIILILSFVIIVPFFSGCSLPFRRRDPDQVLAKYDEIVERFKDEENMQNSFFDTKDRFKFGYNDQLTSLFIQDPNNIFMPLKTKYPVVIDSVWEYYYVYKNQLNFYNDEWDQDSVSEMYYLLNKIDDQLHSVHSSRDRFLLNVNNLFDPETNEFNYTLTIKRHYNDYVDELDKFIGLSVDFVKIFTYGSSLLFDNVYSDDEYRILYETEFLVLPLYSLFQASEIVYIYNINFENTLREESNDTNELIVNKMLNSIDILRNIILKMELNSNDPGQEEKVLSDSALRNHDIVKNHISVLRASSASLINATAEIKELEGSSNNHLLDSYISFINHEVVKFLNLMDYNYTYLTLVEEIVDTN